MDSNNITGLTLTDRKYRSFGQEGVPSMEGSPVFQLAGGVFTTGGFAYSHLDAVPFHFTQDGKLMTDTELEVSGVVIGNVKVFSTDNTAPNAVYGKVGADQTLIAQTSGGVLAVQSGTAWACSGLNYSKVIPSGTFILGSQTTYVNAVQNVDPWGVSGLNYSKVIPSGTFYANVQAGSVITTQSRDMVGSMYVPAGSVIVTQGRDLIGSMYIPAGSVIVTNTVACSGLNYGYVIPSGTFYANVSNVVAVSGILTIGSIAIDIEYLHVEPSGTFYSTVAASGGVALPISGAVNQGTIPWSVSGLNYGYVIPSGTFYSNVQAGSVIVTAGYSSVSPSGTFILGSQTIYVDVAQPIVIGSISLDVDNINVSPSGTFYATVGHSGTFYVASNPTGTFWTSVSPSGTFYSNISAGSVIVTNTVAISGNNYTSVIPSGTFILGSQTGYIDLIQSVTPWGISGGVTVQAGSVIVTNTIGVSGLNYGYVIPSGTFILGSQTTYSNVTIGSQATMYMIMCGLQSGTSTIIPLQCNALGMLLISGV